jgi:D-beta-D-heptose 7-phosphate kinase / D-beta-D-heptose 1-phosphate adenosyltransferase
MSSKLANIVHAFAGKRILLVGDLILDRYVYGDAERISPEAPVPVLRTVESSETVGGSANVAACLRALGCRVTCCGVVGEDLHGRTLRTMLSELGCDTSGVIADDSRPTTTKTRLVGLAQHRHRQQLLRVDEEDRSPLSGAIASDLSKFAVSAVATADAICIEDYDKGVISQSLVEAIVAEASKTKTPVLVDPARLTSYDRYRGATVVTPNREELSIASGTRCNDTDAAATAAMRVLKESGIDSAVVTLDRDGAIVVARGESEHVPTIPRSVYDNTGAGDAVLSMLAAAIAAGAELRDAARLANVSGGLEVEKFGCVPIKADEVLADLRLSERSENGKLCSCDELIAELTLRRDRGESVAFTNGCFDILHAGHVDFLKRCRREASLLVVGLNADASIRRLGKGDDRPINPFEDRAAVLSALECIDYVVGFEEDTPENLIRSIKPDVLAKGEDWAQKGIVGGDFVKKNGGKVVLIPLVKGRSTTSVIERIRNTKSD